MAKAPPVSYGSPVKLRRAHDRQAEVPTPLPAERPPTDQPLLHEAGPVGRRRPMESRSDPTIVYMHPDGKYELKRYALARGPKVKVHDLLMEAIEEWAERHGIRAPFRVPSERPRKPQ